MLSPPRRAHFILKTARGSDVVVDSRFRSAALKLRWKLTSQVLLMIPVHLESLRERDERTDRPRGLLRTHVGPGRGRRPGGFQ